MDQKLIFDRIFRNLFGMGRPNQNPKGEYSSLPLEQALDKAWDDVQKTLYCYELPPPKISEDSRTSTACINMVSHQITVNKGFVDYLASRGMDYYSIFNGILSHEAGHYKDMPWDLKSLIRMQHKASQACGDDGDKKDALTNYFTDVSLNLNLILNKGNDHIRQIYKNLTKDSRIEALLSKVYEWKTELSFDSPKLAPELHDKFLELRKIKFTDRDEKAVLSNIERFTEIVHELLDNENPGGFMGGAAGQGEGLGQGSGRGGRNRNGTKGNKSNGNYSLAGIDDFGIGAYDANEVRRALREIAEESAEPSEFTGIYDFVQKSLEESDRKNNIGSPGKPGTKRTSQQKQGRELDALIEYYSILADAHPIKVDDKETFAGREQRKTKLKPWEADNPLNDIDVFNSYGKFMPSITKSWNYTGGSIGKEKAKATPDLLLIIDSSGSMTDPASAKSNAVLGAFCAAKEYLKKSGQVSVINFSDETKAHDFCSDYTKIASRIIEYQNQGTTLDEETIDKAVSKAKKETDIILITDCAISNLHSVMKLLDSKANANRISLFYINDSSRDNRRVADWLGKKDKISYYRIRDEKDIPGIIIRDMIKSGVMSI